MDMHGTFRFFEKVSIGPVAGDETLIFAPPYTSCADSLTASTNGSLTSVREGASPCKNLTLNDLSSKPLSTRYFLSPLKLDSRVHFWYESEINFYARCRGDNGLRTFACIPGDHTSNITGRH